MGDERDKNPRTEILALRNYSELAQNILRTSSEFAPTAQNILRNYSELAQNILRTSSEFAPTAQNIFRTYSEFLRTAHNVAQRNSIILSTNT